MEKRRCDVKNRYAGYLDLKNAYGQAVCAMYLRARPILR